MQPGLGGLRDCAGEDLYSAIGQTGRADVESKPLAVPFPAIDWMRESPRC